MDLVGVGAEVAGTVEVVEVVGALEGLGGVGKAVDGKGAVETGEVEREEAAREAKKTISPTITYSPTENPQMSHVHTLESQISVDWTAQVRLDGPDEVRAVMFCTPTLKVATMWSDDADCAHAEAAPLTREEVQKMLSDTVAGAIRDALAAAAAGSSGSTVLWGSPNTRRVSFAQDILAQAVHSGEVPDNIGGPSGVGILSGGLDTLSPVVPHQEGSALRGHDLRFYPTEDLGKEPKDGCTTLLEWERGFWTMARTAPALQHKLFMYFHMWFVSKVAIYGFAAMAKFYDFFNLRMEADDFVSFKLGSYSDTFTAYLMKTNTQPQGGGGAGAGKNKKPKPVMGGGGGCGPPPTEAAVEEQLRQEEEPVEELEGIEGEVLWLDLGETEELGGANRGDEMEITECWGRGLAPA
eukprot:gene3854-4815_t